MLLHPGQGLLLDEGVANFSLVQLLQPYELEELHAQDSPEAEAFVGAVCHRLRRVRARKR